MSVCLLSRLKRYTTISSFTSWLPRDIITRRRSNFNTSKDESAKSLSLAAAELVKAAYKQTKVESTALKTDMNNKLNTVNQNLHDNQKTMESLMAAITTLNTTMKEEGKTNRIVNALNSERERERATGWCYDDNGHDYSENLISDILFYFIQGQGCYIDTYTARDLSYDEDGPMKEESKEESKEAFRDKLKDEIMIITGTIPTIKLIDGRWVIFHG